MIRMISIVSRARATGRSKRTPRQPSITLGPLVPIPRRNRPADRAGSDIADIASMAGARGPSCTIRSSFTPEDPGARNLLFARSFGHPTRSSLMGPGAVVNVGRESFENLYGLWGPVNDQRVEGVPQADLGHTVQVAQDGTPYTCL